MKMMNIKSFMFIICLFAVSGFMIGVYTVDISAQESTSEQAGISNINQNPLKERVSLKIESVRYTAKGRRDPFVSIISLSREKMSIQKKSANPLENYDVADFKLLGVIFDGKNYYASVVLPDQKAYTLKKGMNVGVYSGKIIDITSDKLVVKELVVDFMGERKPKYTEIKLRSEEVQ